MEKEPCESWAWIKAEERDRGILLMLSNSHSVERTSWAEMASSMCQRVKVIKGLNGVISEEGRRVKPRLL